MSKQELARQTFKQLVYIVQRSSKIKLLALNKFSTSSIEFL